MEIPTTAQPVPMKDLAFGFFIGISSSIIMSVVFSVLFSVLLTFSKIATVLDAHMQTVGVVSTLIYYGLAILLLIVLHKKQKNKFLTIGTGVGLVMGFIFLGILFSQFVQ